MRYSVRPTRLDDATQQLAHAAERWDRRRCTIKRPAEQAHAAALAAEDRVGDA